MESGRETRSVVGSSATRTQVNSQGDPQGGGADNGNGDGRDIASTAIRQVKETASSLAHTTNNKVQDVLDHQVGKGAEIIGSIAGSIRAAASDLEQTSPQLAALVRGGADRVDEFSQTVQGRSAIELLREGTDFARRQPAIVFGGMTLLGFGLYRLFATKPETDGAPYPGHFGDEGETEGVFQPSDGSSPNSTLRVYRQEGFDGL